MRESSHSLKRMDTRLRGYDEFTGLAKVLKYSVFLSGTTPHKLPLPRLADERLPDPTLLLISASAHHTQAGRRMDTRLDGL